MVVQVLAAAPAFVDFDRMFGALADHTRRDIVRRAITAEEGIVELASHYSMSFAAVQKHIAILERAGLDTRTCRSRSYCEHLWKLGAGEQPGRVKATA